MKSLHKVIVFTTLACLITTTFLVVRNFGRTEEEDVKKIPQSGAARQLETWWWARAYPDPTYINDKWWDAWEHEKVLRASQKNYGAAARVVGGNWSTIGPNHSAGPGGRMLSIAINPVKTSTLFAGSASGGIWKSYNSGGSWTYVPTDLPLLGVSSIIINPSDTNVIYAGTGEVYRTVNGNMGYSVWKCRGTYGIGVIKSTDGGVTWSQVLNKSMSDLFGVQKLKFHPSNSNTIYACATDGLYRSTDGGANWTNIAPGKTYVSDVVINTGDDKEILIAVGNMTDAGKGVYRTTNGNSTSPTWTKVSTGLPTSFGGFGRFGYLSGETVYVTQSDLSATRELYRSTNFGESWSSLSNSAFTDIQYWFTNAIAVRPGEVGTVILGGVNLYRWTAGTGTSGSRTTIGGSVHSDFHDIQYDPSNNSTFYVACDGGIYKTTNNGSNFTKCNNGLGATQFYASFGVSTQTPNLFLGGLQDNGAWRYNNGVWTEMTWMGGDGTTCAIKPGDDATMIASRDARGLYRSTNGGSTGGNVARYWGFNADSRTGFVAPLTFCPSNPNRVYCATDVLHVSNSSGAKDTWSGEAYGGGTPPTSPNNYIEQRHKTAIALAVSYQDQNKIYASTSPFAQYDNDNHNVYYNPPPNLLKTTNGSTPFTSIKNNLPDRFVMDIAISPTNDDSVMVVLGGFGTSHVWVTGNGGSTWTDVGAGLPDVPFNAIVFDPDNTNIVYVGSDMGVYVSPNRGGTWLSFSNGMNDVTQIFDLQITADKKLLAATHGKGAWLSELADFGSLPVNILEFRGKRNNDYNELIWKVSDERNVSHYELERRVDNGNFVKVADITARNLNGDHTYTYNDNISNVAGRNFYYRLKVVDIDGSVEYSGVVLLKVHRPGKFEILGNPITANSSMRLTLTSPQTVTFRLFDMKGRLIKVNKVSASAGANVYSFNMFGMLATGQYVVEAITPNERFTKRIVKN